ncbi:MAG: PAS domain-containing protein [Deltaproteobacteria bacterium]|nr:PAS domain-containing protein [Deltaproteobacteria bacterium]
MSVRLQNLRESNDFLNILFEKMPSLVLLADQDMKIVELNDVYETLFGQSRESAIGVRCGNALGCAFAVTEGRLCGETTNCDRCRIRQAAQASLLDKTPTDREKLVHSFFIDGQKEERHFEFSTRPIRFDGRDLVMLILYDVTDLERKNQALVKKQAKIDESLQAAGCIQQNLLPKSLPRPDRLDFAWHCRPCDEIGGDILNVLSLDGDHVGFYMLDVAGHGAPSAMISVLVYQLMDPHTGILVDHTATPPAIRGPEEVLDILNREFPYMRFERHFTMVYGIVDLTEGTLTYSNAAHCHPTVLSPRHGLRFLTESGTIVGLEGVPFGQETIHLAPGDKVLLVSDGLLEATDSGRRMFGDERFEDLLADLRHVSPADLIQGLLNDLQAFIGDQPLTDDVSLLAFEYRDA